MATNQYIAKEEIIENKQVNTRFKSNNQSENKSHRSNDWQCLDSRVFNKNPKIFDTENEDDCETSVCVCCLYELRTYVIYSCMHYVCLYCSVKMRVLCEKFDCPICRQISTEVICTRKKIEDKSIFEKELEKYKRKPALNGMFYYKLDVVKVEYEQLLGSFCKLCHEKPMFKSLDELENHLKRIHKRFYCELCLKNVKLFPYERKYYNCEELAQHRREGDSKDQSYQGHPICDYCDERFFDHDDLYRHYRKEHLYCHFCDSDGYEEYYKTINQLHSHFKKCHYLCELEECAWTMNGNLQEYSVFRTELDYQAHKMQKHARTKNESKNFGKLKIEFNIVNPIRDRIKTHRQHQMHNEADHNKNFISVSPPLSSNNHDINRLRENLVQENPNENSEYVSQKTNSLDINQEHGLQSQQTIWRDLISNGPSHVNLENDFPCLSDDKMLQNSLNSLGESKTRSSNVWLKKPNETQIKSSKRKESGKVNTILDKDEVIGKTVGLKATFQAKVSSVTIEDNEHIKSKLINKEDKELLLARDSNNERKKPPGFELKEEFPELATSFSNMNSNLTTKAPPGFQNTFLQLKTEIEEDYIKPLNYEYKNSELSEKLRLFFQSNFETIKQWSTDYSSASNLSAKQYLNRCKSLVEKIEGLKIDDKYKTFFNLIEEMIVLLPNIKKQNDLYDAYLAELKQMNFNNTTKWLFATSSSAHYTINLANCINCNQLLMKNDMISHMDSHRSQKNPKQIFPFKRPCS